jgi:aspartate kinase
VPGKQLHVETAPAHVTVVISRENLHDEARVRGSLASRFGDTVRLIDGLGAVSAIGAGINATYANVRAGSAALRAAGVEPRGVATSSFRITWTVGRDRLDEAVRALHGRFIDSAPPPVP